MGSASIQFHALPEELTAIAEEIRLASNANAILFVAAPFCAMPWNNKVAREYNKLAGVAYALGGWRQAKSRYDFIIGNPDALVLDFGRITENGLEESWLSYKTSDDASVKLWKMMVSILKKKTNSGAIAFNPKTGESSAIKSHRYTLGAKEAAESGINMLPSAGKSLIKFSN